MDDSVLDKDRAAMLADYQGGKTDITFFRMAGQRYAQMQTGLPEDGFCTIPGVLVHGKPKPKTWEDWLMFCKGCTDSWGDPKTYQFQLTDAEGNGFPCRCLVHDVRTHATATDGFYLVRLLQYPGHFPSARAATERAIKKFLSTTAEGLSVTRQVVITDIDPIICQPGDLPDEPKLVEDDVLSHAKPHAGKYRSKGEKRQARRRY